MLTSNDECMEGFTQPECDLVNEAVSALMARSFANLHAEDIAVNNWRLLHENSIASLTRTNNRPYSAVFNGKTMNRFAYRAYYQYNGPSHDDPFRSEKSAREVAEALVRFPSDLEHFLDPGASIEAPQVQADPSSSFVTVVTLADERSIDAVVKKCLNSLDLFGEKLSAA